MERGPRLVLGPPARLGREVLGRLGAKPPIVLADAGDLVQKQNPLEIAIHQPDGGEQAEDEQRGKHDGDEGYEQVG